MAKEARERAIKADGGYIRCAALATKDDAVHVIFKGQTEERGYYMTHAMYDAIPLLETATPADYERYGTLIPAPTEFDYAR